MNDDQKGLLYLFERPYEPIKNPRARGKILFQQEGEVDEDLASLFTSATPMNVPTRPDIMQDLHKCQAVPKGVPFSLFDSQHIEAAKELCERFLDPAISDMALCWHAAASIKDSVNEELFIFALSYAIVKNPAFDSRLVPAIYEVFPSKFISQDTMDKVTDELQSTKLKNPETSPEETPEEIVITHDIDFTGSNRNPEHRVSYWREDYGLNAHHWHWHVVFRPERDRKGEIFFYMHSQMLIRYDWERLSNSLDRVVGLDNWREPIPDGYFPRLTINNSSSQYGNRPDNMTTRGGILTPNITEMEQWRLRLEDAIRKGYMINDEEEHVKLSDNVDPGEKRGIDILTDALEPSPLSLNRREYGELHNAGHRMIAYIHDPDAIHFDFDELQPGVMASLQTACRDPVFWRWHKFVDDVCQKYKMQQVPYEDNELIFESVEVESVAVKSGELEENVLETGWTYTSVEASRGLDFGKDQSVKIELQHLNHRPFTYHIQVTNNQTEPVDVTVRLYMAAKLNIAGETMTYMDQRLLWAEMDKYKTTLEPGSNSLERLSTESSVTIPDERNFKSIEEDPPKEEDPDYCGCGWPQHLLLPKGKADGMDFQIFALVSDWELDKVEESEAKGTCSNAASFCGILDEKFPDARPMGYPFDRRPNTTVNNVDISNAIDFANALPNAFMSDIKIHFRDSNLSLE